MKADRLLVLAGLLAVPSALLADTMVAESAAAQFAVDSMGSPYSVKDPDEGAGLVCLSGETVTATAPNGDPSTVVASAAADGVYTWRPTAGGVWTLSNPAEGDAQFCVRYSAFGSAGAGTESDPIKIVDNDELSDLAESEAIQSGNVFVLLPPLATESGTVLPHGFAMEALTSGAYRLLAAVDGLLCASAPDSFAVDSCFDKNGCRVYEASQDWLPVSYSGDGWGGASDAASTLTFTPAEGVETEVPCTGTGALDFEPGVRKHGVWTVTLTPANSAYETLVATLKERMGFILIVK